jgi:hypothetical protein
MERTSPLESANLLSRWVFAWLTPLLELGATKPLDAEDIPVLPSAQRSEQAVNDFSALIANEFLPRPSIEPNDGEVPEPHDPSVARCIWQFIGNEYLWAFSIQFLAEALNFTGPVITKLLTSYLSDMSQESYYGWIYVGCLIVLPTIGTILRSQFVIRAWLYVTLIHLACISGVTGLAQSHISDPAHSYMIHAVSLSRCAVDSCPSSSARPWPSAQPVASRPVKAR